MKRHVLGGGTYEEIIPQVGDHLRVRVKGFQLGAPPLLEHSDSIYMYRVHSIGTGTLKEVTLRHARDYATPLKHAVMLINLCNHKFLWWRFKNTKEWMRIKVAVGKESQMRFFMSSPNRRTWLIPDEHLQLWRTVSCLEPPVPT